ncbi:hypothetical protein FIBSPDRAFT_857673 [Athelia psychrophila]|uniref:Uncharacterized protein n=1 Tax=Athelia psychrophila TaxID=1759441 RepID=A0A166MEF5_9AGAM|nr:hypothetical protein FIBSPDRAFT_857673 [Fibularhizoctonia sp. CBS 109695]
MDVRSSMVRPPSPRVLRLHLRPSGLEPQRPGLATCICPYSSFLECRPCHRPQTAVRASEV